jgi:hypothetical protein
MIKWRPAMRCFGICFGEPDPAVFGRLAKWTETFHLETEDGGRAYTQISKMMPDLIIADGDQKPGHVVQTLRAVLQLKKLKDARIIIVTAERPERIIEFAKGTRVEVVSVDELDAILRD